MHEHRRPERRRFDRPALEVQPPCRAERPLEARARLHHEIMGMLIVDERRPLIRLARLKHLRRSELAHRPRLETQHAVQSQLTAADAPAPREHQPVLRFDDTKIPEPALLDVGVEKGLRVEDPLPAFGGRRRLVMLVLGGRRRRAHEDEDTRRDPLHPLRGLIQYACRIRTIAIATAVARKPA
jgi:hypothetical protein